jgi:hypothetical protein
MTPRVSYRHMEFVAKYFKGSYADGESSDPNIVVFGSKNADGISTTRARFGNTTRHFNGERISSETIELHELIVRVASLERVFDAAAAIGHLLDRNHGRDDFQIIGSASLPDWKAPACVVRAHQQGCTAAESGAFTSPSK